MAKAEASVEELVGMIERGELRLPEMQRQYVWQSTRVRDLLDSLYRGYPSGAILLWETDEQVPLQEFAVSQQANPYRSTRLLLDGQQRLTSLSAVIRGEPVKLQGKNRPIEILFNLEHPDTLVSVTEVHEDARDNDDLSEGQEDASDDELLKRLNDRTFVVATKKLEQLPNWIKVSEVFKSESDLSLLRSRVDFSNDDGKLDRYIKRLTRLRDIRKYVYRMDILERSLSYDEVTEIFVRVNSLGAKLRSSDLALAQITARWRHSLEVFQAFQGECTAKGFNFEIGLHLKNLIAFATGQSRFKTVASLSLEQLQKGWKDACEGMFYALNFLRNNVQITSPALLSSPFLVIVIAYFGHQRSYSISADEAELLRNWALLANAKGRFSRGSSETILDQDLAVLKRGGTVQELLDRLRSQVGRLDITPEELEGRNQRSALFKTMFVAFKAARAQDWSSKLEIAIDNSGVQHNLQFHHIFPKALLTKANYSSRDADDIANLAFIGGRTNRKISDKEPKHYLANMIEATPDILTAQAIPVDLSLLSVSDYPAFLAERRKMIVARLNDFLSQTAGTEGGAA